MKRGQFSIEFITVFGVLMIILSSVTLPLYDDSKESVEEIMRMSSARGAANKLGHTIDMAYIEGPGSKKIVDYTLPKGIDNIIVRDSGDSENFMEILIVSDGWQEDNTISVKTLLYRDNHPDIVFENLEKMMISGAHEVRVTCRLDPDEIIKIEEI